MIYRGCDYWKEAGQWFWAPDNVSEGRGPFASEDEVVNKIDEWKKSQLQARSESGMEGSSI